MKHIWLLFLFIAGLTLTTSCKRKQAVWETEWQAPLLKDTLDLDKLITEDSLVVVNGSYLELSIDRTIYELKLSDIVKIPDTTVRHVYAIAATSFNVPAGTSFVNNAKEHVIDMGSIQLKKIRVQSGGIFLQLHNPIGTKAFFTVELPGVTLNGVTLTQDFVAPAGTIANPGLVSGFVDLSGYEMDLRGANFGSYNRIQSKILVTSDPDGPTVSVSNQDSLKVLFNMNDIQLDYARGYFGNDLITDTITEHIAALNKITGGMIDLPEATLDLELVNGMKVAARGMITHLKGTNNQQNTVSLTHPSMGTWMTINSATGNEYALNPSSTSLHFDANNSNLEQFLENHGADNEIGFQVQLNPWGNTSGGWDEIFPQSSLKVNLAATMPLAIGLSDVILQDTFDFSFKQDFSKTHIQSGSIWMDAVNAFPLSGAVTLYLMDASGNVLATINGSEPVASCVYGAMASDGLLHQKSRVEFLIPESAVDDMEAVTQLSVKLVLNTPDEATNVSEQVNIPAGAFFGFKIGAKLKVEARI